MEKVDTYINSATETVRQRWGMTLAETSLTALMTPPPAKDYVTSESRLEHGKRTYANAKADARDVQLVFAIRATTLAQFLMRYQAFCEELKKGAMELTVIVSEGDSYMKTTYRLYYLSCSQFSEYNGRLGRFVLKLNEPDPTNRTVEHSTDIDI